MSRRNFFDLLAFEKKFNPLDVNSWYELTPADIKQRKVS